MRPGVAAAALAAYSAVCLALGAVLVLTHPDRVGDHFAYWVLTAASVPNVVLVITLLVRLPRHAITIVLAVGVVLSMAGNGPALLVHGAARDGPDGVLADLAWLGGIPLLPLLFVLFPSGWPRDRWRWLASAEVAALGTLAGIVVLRRLEVGISPVLTLATGVCAAVLLVGAVAAGTRLCVRAVRQRRSHRENTPFAAVTALILLLYLVFPLLNELLQLHTSEMPLLVFAGLVFGPQMAIGYGVLRHQLFGLDIAIRRVAIAAAAAMTIFALYLVAAIGIGALFHLPRAALAAVLLPAALAVMVLAPAHRFAQRFAERRIYGDRRDPRGLLLHLARELAMVAPDQVADLVAARTADGLHLPWVGVELEREGSLVDVASAGTPRDVPTSSVDLRHVGDVIGRLSAQPRRGQSELGRRDRRALEQVAVQVAPALSAARLIGELTDSRERLVLGREAERARLRRELHDGLSPSLAGMSLALGAARRSLGDVPVEADRLLTTVQEESTLAWQAVRSLLADLRPPGLEELGLVGALEDRARQLGRPEDFVVSVQVCPLPPLPSAVEVAAFRIATEAMTNAARHSGGHRCQVAISVNGALEIVVRDDGTGMGVPGPTRGVGLDSMLERAHELGGQLQFYPGATGGTVVIARLPVGVPT